MLEEIEQEQKKTGIKADLQHFAEKIRKKLSKVYSNTLTKSGIADELGLKAEDFEYIEKSEASQMEEANDRLGS